MVLTYTPNEVGHQWLKWGSNKPTASQWHSSRRAAIIRRYPEVLNLLTPEPLTPIVMAGLAVSHLGIAYALRSSPWWAVGVASVTVGSLLAFDIQALNHELCHQRAPSSAALGAAWHTLCNGSWAAASTFLDLLLCNKYMSTVVALAGSACTSVPWFSYYHQGGHQMHHLHAGSPYDNDGQAFFWAWEQAPHPLLDNPLGMVLWTSTVALLLPIIYFVSLGTWFFYFPRANCREMLFASVDVSATAIVYYTIHNLAGPKGLTYLVLSTAFSIGLLAHPLLAFWIAQHVCENPPSRDGDIMSDGEHRFLWQHVKDTLQPSYQFTAQPTLSYYGSSLWNWLTMNELLHVEHHDFQHMPWTKTPQLSRIAPEFYLPPPDATRPRQQAPCRCQTDTPSDDCSCRLTQQYQAQHPHPWDEWKDILDPPPPMRCIPRLMQDLLLPYYLLRGVKFDFACRHALMHHAATRQTIAVRVMEALGISPYFGEEDEEGRTV
eukprot:m.108078 g.108078  ORF g.108078 m.108078 type:complete len:490 (+) comp15329_c0_seq1:109-1578(+)